MSLKERVVDLNAKYGKQISASTLNVYYKKAGVIVMDIVPENPNQLGLFENQNEAHKQVMTTMDKLNLSLGGNKIKLGVQDLERTWKMKQERLSPKYTTKLTDIITVKA